MVFAFVALLVILIAVLHSSMLEHSWLKGTMKLHHTYFLCRYMTSKSYTHCNHIPIQ